MSHFPARVMVLQGEARQNGAAGERSLAGWGLGWGCDWTGRPAGRVRIPARERFGVDLVDSGELFTFIKQVVLIN